MKRLQLYFFLALFVGLSVATAGIVFTQLGGSGAASALAETDEFETMDFHPFTMDPANFDCPQSEHTYWYVNYRDCDPVNLIFEDMNVVEVSLALQASGWTTFGLGGLQFLHLDNQDWPLVQSAQLFRRYEGGNGPCDDGVQMCRYHIRLWDIPGRGVVGAVHFEDGNLFDHDLKESWEYAESRVCDDFDDLPRYECDSDAVDLDEQASIQDGDSWRSNSGFSGLNDKRASLIERDWR